MNLALFSEPTISWAIPYSLLPIQILLLFRYSKNGKLVNLLLADCTIPFSNLIPIWLLILPIFSMVTIIYSKVFFKISLFKYLIRQLEFFGGMILSSMFIIIPILISYHYGVGGIYNNFSIGHTHGNITYNSAVSHSYSNLWLAILLAHPSMFLFHYYSADWTLLTFLLPIISLTAVFLYYDDKFIQFSFIILLIGIFLSKGANPPFGYFYFLLLRYSPPGTNGLIFDVTPFQILETIGYALILSRFLYLLFLLVEPKKYKSIKQFFSNYKSFTNFVGRNSKIASIGLLAILLVSVSSGSVIQANNSLHYYGPQNIPNSYLQTIEYLNTNARGYNVIWAPINGNSPGILSQSGVSWTAVPFEYQGNGFPAVLSNLNYKSPMFLNYLNYTHNIGKLLALQDVKYIIVHNDASINMQQLEYSLHNQSDLKLVKSFGNLTIWLNMENVSSNWIGNAIKIEGDVSISNLLQIGFDPLNSIIINNYTGKTINGYIGIANNISLDELSGSNRLNNVVLFANTTFGNLKRATIQTNGGANYYVTSDSNQFRIVNITIEKDSVQVQMDYNISKKYLNQTHNISPSQTFFELYLMSNSSTSKSYYSFPISITKYNLTEGNLVFNISLLDPGKYSAAIKIYNPGFNFTYGSPPLFYLNIPGASIKNNSLNLGTHLYMYNTSIKSSVVLPEILHSVSLNVSLFIKGDITMTIGNSSYSFDSKCVPELFTFKTKLITNLTTVPIWFKSNGISNIYSLSFSNFNFNKPNLIPIEPISNSNQVNLKFINKEKDKFITTSIIYSNGWISNASLNQEFFSGNIAVGPTNGNISLTYLPQKFSYLGIGISIIFNGSLILIPFLLYYKRRFLLD